MTTHYFENSFAKLHYYQFGTGPAYMLCFHGFGMHGKQFKILADRLGGKYTFIGFDLFFHKETLLNDQSLATIKAGLQKKQLASLITDFCQSMQIDRFSVLAYSMGTHYATAIVEEMGDVVDAYIVAASAALRPGFLVWFFSKSVLGNKLLEKIMLSEKATVRIINILSKLGLLDKVGKAILEKEVGTPALRFALYATFTYLRFLKTDESRLITALTSNNIRSLFIFGKYDKMYPPSIGRVFFRKYNRAEIVVLEADHEMINSNFADTLTRLLL
ncbi:MAG: alpha/beta hydrolase [Bacteroidota bacterium]